MHLRTILSTYDSLAYTITCGEMNFRGIPAKSRTNRLVRWTSNINTFIAALWALSNVGDSNTNMRDMSWQYIPILFAKTKLLQIIEQNNMSPLMEDVFAILCRGV